MVMCFSPAVAIAGQLADLTTLSLEQLLNVEVVSASKVAQKTSDVPASMTVVTAKEIQDFGYRTLADVLSSVRGFDVTSDHIYRYVAVRGFSPPGDFNNRLLVMIDGIRTNDAIYDQAFIGTDLAISLDLVERIEIIRGPGASIYGGNALLGVVNLITRSGATSGGAQVSASQASGNATALSASWGGKLENGADILLSLDGERASGRTLTFPEMGGSTSTTDKLDNARAFLKLARDGLTVTAGLSRRDKGNPGAINSAVLDDPRNVISDDQGYLDVRQVATLGAMEWMGRFFLGSYDFTGNYVLSGTPNYVSRDVGHARWGGFELRGATPMGAHHWVYGIEAQNDWKRHQTNTDTRDQTVLLDHNLGSRRTGLFVQDEFRASPVLTLTGGLRHDQITGQDAEWSPRLAAVWKPRNDTTARLLYGTAHRAPNAYEMHYGVASFNMLANTTLKSEKIRTWEAALDHFLHRDMRLTATTYLYRMENQISQVRVGSNLQYQNMKDVLGRGAEFEAERLWSDGSRLRTSLAFQSAKDYDGAWPLNSPRRQLKLSWTKSLPERFRLGVDGRATSARRTNTGVTGGYARVDLTLSRPLIQGMEVSASFYNLFDRTVGDPIGDDAMGITRDTFTAEGRSFRLKITSRF